MHNEEIINKIIKGDKDVVIHLYRLYRNDFIKWAQRKIGCREEDAKDIFQDVILSFYNKVLERKLTVIDSSLKTYLFAGGRNLLLNEIKKQGKFVNLSDFEFTNDEITNIEKMENTHQDKEIINKALEELPNDEQEILKLFYFENYTLQAIAEKLGYKNANVVKTKKSNSMKKIGLVVRKLSKGLKMLLLVI